MNNIAKSSRNTGVYSNIRKNSVLPVLSNYKNNISYQSLNSNDIEDSELFNKNKSYNENSKFNDTE
jgi:hypothetical protein